jgi:drug/metabolite transporter (DMT)-like permease
MIGSSSLWVVFTIVAAVAQTFRNAAQKALSNQLGTLGATYIRFLFGLPFALLALGLFALWGHDLPRPTWASLLWTLLGAVSQIAATAAMLAAMRQRSFLVAIAYTHVEPLLVALFALIFLGDTVTPLLAAAILISIAGVISLSWPQRAAGEVTSSVPAMLGVASGGLFAMAAVGFRGGIVALGPADFILAATEILAISLTIQTALLTAWIAARKPQTLANVMSAWRPSLGAGFLGAFASENWFLAFALTNPARVRTLALVEILVAALISQKLFAQTPGLREVIGIGLTIIGVAALVNS